MQINDPLGPWQRPQVVIRFGYGPKVPSTPRRDIADVTLRQSKPGPSALQPSRVPPVE